MCKTWFIHVYTGGNETKTGLSEESFLRSGACTCRTSARQDARNCGERKHARRGVRLTPSLLAQCLEQLDMNGT